MTTITTTTTTYLQFELEEKLGVRRLLGPTAATMCAPALGASAASATYFATAGPRAAGLAGVMGLGVVGATYVTYSVLGIPYGSQGFLFF
jgi:hypothetical protein